ncbi:MAG: putative lipid II flippase FtsW [Dehalococcoidia bacterium]|nr:putative lipid II flippase FtsW [Dehalococcoidia bacterium]MCA9844984.1 putative lipid II flippase FtsW [Dehalococcoidia bacterium]
MSRRRETGERVAGRPDYALLLIVAVLTITGLITVYSASFVIGLAWYGDPNYFILRQAMWAGLGLVLMVVAMQSDYRVLRSMAVPIMAFTILMLLAVLVIGAEGGGARRWLGSGPYTIQPAEFAKLAVIIYLAAWLAAKGNSIRSLEEGLIPFVLIIGSVAVLIVLEPNLGTTLIILLITVTMFYVAGATLLQMTALGVTGLISMAILATAAGYRLDRLYSYFDAEGDPLGRGFQTLQSLIALGNGGITGLGLGTSRGKFFYIPESHTDGVFAVLGEEAGLIATSMVVLLFVTLMLRGYHIARRAPDDFGTLVATGITTWIAVQAMLNIGGITRTIPLTGVPLPFLSYGGSALASVMLAMGVLLSITRYMPNSSSYLDRVREPARRVVRRAKA